MKNAFLYWKRPSRLERKRISIEMCSALGVGRHPNSLSEKLHLPWLVNEEGA